MRVKKLVKAFIPKDAWVSIRRKRIMLKHCKVASSLSYLVSEEPQKLSFVEKVAFPQNQIIIWQYWAQGYEEDKMPPLVRICLASVDKFATNYQIVRLSDANLSMYIDLPDWLMEKKQHMPIAHFSDLLRCILLSVYGGLWLDASIFLTGELPKYLFQYDFFMYQRDPLEVHKTYWESTFAYYFGWGKGFRVNVLNGIMYAKKGNKVISDFCSMLIEFWKHNRKTPDYFFFQILFDIYMEKNGSLNCPIVNDCIPHMLRQIINEDTAPPFTIEEAKKTTSLHSLNYKNNNAVNRLKQLFPEYQKL